MAHRLFSELSASPLTRAIVVTIAVFVFLGAATGALPVRCLTGGADACGTKPIAAAAAGPTVIGDTAPTAVPVTTPVAAIDAVQAAPTITHNDLIATTFALLPSQLQPPQPVAEAADAKGTDAPAPLASRVVKTLAVGPDGQLAGMSQAYAPSDKVEPLAPSTPAVDAATAEAQVATADIPATATPTVAAESSAAAEQPPATATAEAAPAPSASNLATVKGSGANVRSSPTKAAGNVLFALRGGSQVTIVGTKRGWLQITDDKGRTGWLFQDYVTH